MLSQASREITSRTERAFSRAAATERRRQTGAASLKVRYSCTASPSAAASGPSSRRKRSSSPAVMMTGCQHSSWVRSESSAIVEVTWRSRAVLSARSR